MRSETSPVMAPLYWPTQARSDCSASRSPCAIALAVSAGVCNAGRAGTVATGFGLTPGGDCVVNCAWADAPKLSKIRDAPIEVADGTDLMTSPDPDLGSLTCPQLSTSGW